MTFARLSRGLTIGLAAIMGTFRCWGAEQLNFRSSPMTVGKASLL